MKRLNGMDILFYMNDVDDGLVMESMELIAPLPLPLSGKASRRGLFGSVGGSAWAAVAGIAVAVGLLAAIILAAFKLPEMLSAFFGSDETETSEAYTDEPEMTEDDTDAPVTETQAESEAESESETEAETEVEPPPPPSEGLLFESNGDGTCGVSGWGSCTDSHLVIPTHSPEGDRVTLIKKSAFRESAHLTEVTIPEGVETIDGWAFYGCDALTEIHFSEGLQNIYWGAFSNCDALTSVRLPEGLIEVGINGFAFCDELRSVAIPDSVEIIRQLAFATCRKLEEISFGENSRLTTIEKRAFAECNLLGLDLPESLEWIHLQAFEYNENLTELRLPSKLRGLKNYAFSHCSRLEKITLTSYGMSIGYGAFKFCTELEEIHCPSLKTWISIGYSMDDCPLIYGADLYIAGEKLTELTMPDNIPKIGGHRFYECDSLTQITVGADSKLSSIGSYAFFSCSRLTTVTFDNVDTLTKIDQYAFSKCPMLTDIYYAGTVEQWQRIPVDDTWCQDNYRTITVHCSDGELTYMPE